MGLLTKTVDVNQLQGIEARHATTSVFSRVTDSSTFIALTDAAAAIIIA